MCLSWVWTPTIGQQWISSSCGAVCLCILPSPSPCTATACTWSSHPLFLSLVSVHPFLTTSAHTIYVCFKWLQMTQSFSGTARNSLNQPNVWLTILLTTILCSLPVVAKRFLFIQLKPTINDKVGDSTSSFSNTIYQCCCTWYHSVRPWALKHLDSGLGLDNNIAIYEPKRHKIELVFP